MSIATRPPLWRSRAKVVFALPAAMLRGESNTKMGVFYSKLEAELSAIGAEIVKIPLARRPFERRGNAENLVLLHNGARRLCNVLNTGQAYLDGYWHVDAKGILGMNSASDVPFDQSAIVSDIAREYFDHLRESFVMPRRSRYGQRQDRVALPDQSIAVFLQGDTETTRRTMLDGCDDMIRSVVLGARGRPVVIKHHPLRTNPADIATIAELRAEGEVIIETDANVHDILEKCLVTVSISSGACFEGFLHEKPAIFFGRSDLKQIAYQANDANTFENALESALCDKRSYDRFVYWYMTEHCISPHSPRFLKFVLRRADLLGFGPDRLGLDYDAARMLLGTED